MDIKKLRQKILDLAISGKLVPQDPNDEPASVLLERIRAEKERLIAEGKIKRPKKSKSSSAESHYQNFTPPFPIPDSWEWVSVAEIGEIVTGNTPPKDIQKYYGGEIPFFKPTDLEQGIETVNSSDHLSDLGYKQSRQLPVNTILITCIGATIGKAGLIKREGACNQQINAIIPVAQINPEYIYFSCVSGYFQDAIRERASATTLPILNKNNFSNLLLPLPPAKEQYRIIKQIYKLLGELIEIESSEEKLGAIIDIAKSKILDLAMQGKLVPQDPADEPAADMLRRINPKAKIITDNPHYPQLPDNWVLVPLEDITEYEQPQPYIVQDTSYSDRYTIPVLTAGKSFILGYTNEDFGVYENVPAIIFDDFTTDSRLVNFPFKVKSSAMKIIQVKHGLNIEYIALFMSITRLMGETHKRYWISEYSKILIPIPPLKEQDRIVERVNVLYHELYKIISVLSA